MVGSFAQFRGGRAQRLRGGRQDTGYAAPPVDGYAEPAQPAYGDDQDVYQVDEDDISSETDEASFYGCHYSCSIQHFLNITPGWILMPTIYLLT